jgi:hypothetical protein
LAGPTFPVRDFGPHRSVNGNLHSFALDAANLSPPPSRASADRPNAAGAAPTNLKLGLKRSKPRTAGPVRPTRRPRRPPPLLGSCSGQGQAYRQRRAADYGAPAASHDKCWVNLRASLKPRVLARGALLDTVWSTALSRCPSTGKSSARPWPNGARASTLLRSGPLL